MYEEIKEIYPEIPIGDANNLINKIFGNWTVLYRTTNNSRNKTMWVCQCSCKQKTIKPVLGSSLTHNVSTSCGCNRFNIINKNNDKRIHIRDKNGNIIQKKCCRCHQWLPINNFYRTKYQKDGFTSSCKKCDSQSKESRYNIYRKNAKRRKIGFFLNKDEFYNITSKPCHYCGEYSNKTINNILYNGIDRINSSKDYTLDNIVPCCDICNKMKSDYSLSFFIEHINKIINHMEGE